MSSGYFDGFGYPAWIYATTQQLEWMPYTIPGTFLYNNSACNLNSHILYYATDMTPEEYIEHKKAHPVCVDCGRKKIQNPEDKILIDRISKEHVCKECAGNRPFSTMRFGRL